MISFNKNLLFNFLKNYYEKSIIYLFDIYRYIFKMIYFNATKINANVKSILIYYIVKMSLCDPLINTLLAN